MKILVIGKNGMLGNAILETAASWEYEVIGWSRNDLDITDETAVITKISELNPDVVINTAALTNVDLCEEEPETANLINGKAAGFIAKACHQSAAKLIHVSTDYVFNGQDQEGYKEDHPTDPINAYGQSKLLGEQLVQQNCPQHFIIRVSWLFGVNPKALPDRLDFIRQLLSWSQKNSTLTILSNQTGKVTYSYDVANLLPDFLSSSEYGVYHLVNEGSMTRYEFAKKVFAILQQNDITVNPGSLKDLNITLKAPRPEHSSLINTKIKPLRDWENALTEYLQRFYE